MRVVSVFGGGGAKSLAHAGAWKALLEAGYQPSHIVGTSMGAVIGAAFADGSTYERLVEIALSLQKKDFAALDAWSLAKGVFAGNILKPEPLKRTIARLVPATRFAELQIPLTITATDLDSGELVLFGALGEDAPLIDALYASCALPLYLPPEAIDGRRLGDGGRGSRVRRAAGCEASSDPAAGAGARRSDPCHDGGADRARHRRLAQRCAPARDGTRGGGAGSDIRGGRCRALSRGGVPEDP